MSQTSDRAVRAQNFIHSIGINVHMEYTDGAYANTGNVVQDLAYLGITNIRDMIPNVPAGGIPAANEVTSLEALAAGGVKMDLFVGATESNIPADIAIVNNLDAATPGAVEAIEGLNEINNNPPSYDGLTGQAAATAEQDAIYAAVKADSTLSGAAVFDFTGGSAPTATPYGTMTYNADGSETLVNGITGWLVTLPAGVTTMTITYTGAAPLAGLFGYPGAAQETGLTQGANGTLSFTYDNTSGAAMQTYVTASDWNQTTTFTSVKAVPSGSTQNLVDFNPVVNLTGQASDANAHPYPSGGAPPGAAIASAYVDPYGTAAPGAGVITEDGYNTDPNASNGVSQLAQAQGELDILLDGYASGVSQTYLYELLDEKPDPGNTNSEMHFGVFNNDNTAKLAATAIHDLTSILADSGAAASNFSTGTLNWSGALPSTARSLLMEKSSGAFDLAVWNETSLGNPAAAVSTIALGGTYDRVEIFDPVSGAAALETFSNVSHVTLSLGADPLIVEIEPQAGGTGPAPCFLAGTRIATARGEVDVAELVIGDEVRTLSWALRRIKWLGRRRYAQPFPRDMVDIIPILICRGALGPGVPARDLYVSPLHAMYLDHVLVPAGLLVNGRSIRPCPEFAEVDYIHVELDSHDVIFAEGAAAETFVDCDSRAMFQNAAEFHALYPGEAAPSWAFCAPRVEGGQTLRRIWRRLAERAGLMLRRPPMTARLEGHLDQVAHDVIEGWAWLPEFADEFVELEVLDHDGVIARVVADRYRGDLAQAGVGGGRHAFRLNFSAGLPADRPHEIHVRRAGGGPELAGSPVMLAAAPGARPGAALLRHEDAGWRPAAAEKRALVLDTCWPAPGRDAGSNAILSHIAGLRELGYAVELVAVDEFAQDPPAALAADVRCRTAREFAAVELLLQGEGAGYALVYMHRLPVVARYAGLVRAHCRGPEGTGAHLVYGVADLHHVRLERQARVENDAALARLAQATRKHEIAALRRADCVITHSFDEAAYIGRVAPEARVRVVPWAVPVRPAAPGARDGVLFVGSFDHAPNPDAVRWLLAEILPLVWRAAPRVTCAIAGAGWPRGALPVLDDRVRLLGHVEDLDGLYAGARLTVAPLRFGAGVKGKVLESFAAGAPCVMTPVAAEGIPLTGPLRELVAGTAEGFARLIGRLHEDAAFNARAAAAGRAMIAARYHGGRVVESLRLAAAPRGRAGA